MRATNHFAIAQSKLLTKEFAGALSGLFPIDGVLEKWLRYKATETALHRSSELSDALDFKRFSHERVDDLFAHQLSADKGAKYAKYLHMNLSTLSPYVSGPNSVKVSTPVEELAARNIKIDKAYLVSCTNSRASDLAAAAKVFKDAVKETGRPAHIADGVEFYIAAASMPEQLAAEEAGDWQAMLDAGAKALPSGCGPVSIEACFTPMPEIPLNNPDFASQSSSADSGFCIVYWFRHWVTRAR